jgi:hypothetical protein|tara:strand:+ start:55 stop:660 length:606 start_codon:yes stop_codon:yes gene_type:complete
MLTACIIYIPGSAGNLLTRCLSLDDSAVPFGKATTAKDKLQEYNNWNSSNWIESETELEVGYQKGEGDFFVHETNPLKLIHRLHPDQFIDGKNNLWTGDFKWQNLIFIAPDDIETIKNLAGAKRTDMDHNQMFKRQMEMYNSLLPEASYIIKFTNILTYDNFSAEVEKLCDLIGVTYYQIYVKQLWDKWYEETTALVWLPK